MFIRTQMLKAAVMIAVGLIANGCNQSIGALQPNTAPPRPLPATPNNQVTRSQLDPINPPAQVGANEVQQSVTDPNTVASETMVASVPPPNAGPVTREGMAGTWQVPSDVGDCRIVLAFTKWAGGYRAAPLRCASAELSSITAWDVKDRQVILVDSGGNTLARLYSSGPERYDGTTRDGKPIALAR